MLFEVHKKLVKGASVAALCVFAAVPAAAETLADALTDAYNSSGLIEKNRATLRAADEDVATAIAQLRPVLSWAGNVQRQFGETRRLVGTVVTPAANFVTNNTSLSLTAEVVLYAGGRNKLAIEAAKESVLATRASLVSVEQQVLLRAVTAYMEVRRSLETLALRRNNLRVIREEVNAAKERFDVGATTRTDVALAQARFSAAKAQLAAAQGDVAAAREEFKAAVGRKPGKLRTPRSLPKLPGSIKAAKGVAVRQHPELDAVQHLVTAREIAVQIAKGARKPSVSLSTSLATQQSFDNKSYTNSGTITLGARGPIYSGGALNAAVRKARAQRDQARADLHLAGIQIEQNVANAYARLATARAARSALEAQVRAARVAFEGVREEAKVGARTTLDVLDAEQELLDARAGLISAQVDETLASYAALAAIGKLTAQNLHLKVPHFDPASYYNLVRKAPSSVSKQGRELDRVLRALGKN